MRIPAVCKLLTVLTLTLALGACHSSAERFRTGDLLFVGSSEGAAMHTAAPTETIFSMPRR